MRLHLSQSAKAPLNVANTHRDQLWILVGQRAAAVKRLADDLAEFADDLAADRVRIFSVGAGGDNEPVAGDNRAFVEVRDGQPHAFNRDAIDRDARTFCRIARVAGLGAGIGCAIARDVDHFVFAIRHLVKQSQ